MKLEFRYESLKRKFSLTLFAHNLLVECSKKIEKIILRNAFEQKKKKPRLKFNPGLALILLAFEQLGPGLEIFFFLNLAFYHLFESEHPFTDNKLMVITEPAVVNATGC